MTPTPGTTPTTPFPAQIPPNPSLTAANTAVTLNSHSQNNQRYRYQSEIQAMMYTFGDVKHPLSATSLLIEDIVHSQIIELVSRTSFFIVLTLLCSNVSV